MTTAKGMGHFLRKHNLSWQMLLEWHTARYAARPEVQKPPVDTKSCAVVHQ